MEIYVDGSNRGNPGTGGIGYVIYSDGQLIKEGQKFIGDNVTNNHAEYEAIIEGIKKLKKLNKNKEACKLYSDSKVVCNQICNGWKINFPHLEKLNKRVKKLLNSLDFDLDIIEIRREQNIKANDLAQEISLKYKTILINGNRSWKGAYCGRFGKN